MTETHIRDIATAIPPPVATNARTLRHSAGYCPACRRLLLAGERAATVARVLEMCAGELRDALTKGGE